VFDTELIQEDFQDVQTLSSNHSKDFDKRSSFEISEMSSHFCRYVIVFQLHTILSSLFDGITSQLWHRPTLDGVSQFLYFINHAILLQDFEKFLFPNLVSFLNAIPTNCLRLFQILNQFIDHFIIDGRGIALAHFL